MMWLLRIFIASTFSSGSLCAECSCQQSHLVARDWKCARNLLRLAEDDDRPVVHRAVEQAPRDHNAVQLHATTFTQQKASLSSKTLTMRGNSAHQSDGDANGVALRDVLDHVAGRLSLFTHECTVSAASTTMPARGVKN